MLFSNPIKSLKPPQVTLFSEHPTLSLMALFIQVCINPEVSLS